MRTYQQLRDEVLKIANEVGSTDAEEVVAALLEQSMRYISTKVELPRLIRSAVATWGEDVESFPLFSNPAGFSINENIFGSTNRLFVKKEATARSPGIPYDFQEYMHFLDLQSVPGGSGRPDIFEPSRVDERPRHAWTITPDDRVVIDPVATSNVATLFYNQLTNSYVGAAVPEIPPKFEHILINGALSGIKEWQREPDTILDLDKIFQILDPQISELDSFLRGRRQRHNLKMGHRYRIR
jgi:hypothetical protein